LADVEQSGAVWSCVDLRSESFYPGSVSPNGSEEQEMLKQSHIGYAPDAVEFRRDIKNFNTDLLVSCL
jgi:hypothetical protein